MKIAFCTKPLKNEHNTRGIGYYTRNLLNGLKKIDGFEIQEFEHISQVKEADIVHYPYFDLFNHTLPIFKKFPTIVTIHDVTPLVFTTHYPVGLRGKMNFFLQSLALKNISAVITDSENSKQDIEKYLEIESNHIFPIYLAASSDFKVINEKYKLDKVKKKYLLPENFVLYTGNVNWNKNLLNLTQACVEAEVNLVLLGSGFEQKDQLNHKELSSYSQFIKQYSNNPKIKILGFVDLEDLVIIMNLANITLLPSFYEGFGLTILESQTCLTPVITSNVASMPEVAGKGAMLIDPNNVQDIKNAIIKINSDNKFRNELIEKGKKNLSRFSWDETVDQTIMVYKQVTNK